MSYSEDQNQKLEPLQKSYNMVNYARNMPPERMPATLMRSIRLEGATTKDLLEQLADTHWGRTVGQNEIAALDKEHGRLLDEEINHEQRLAAAHDDHMRALSRSPPSREEMRELMNKAKQIAKEWPAIEQKLEAFLDRVKQKVRHLQSQRTERND